VARQLRFKRWIYPSISPLGGLAILFVANVVHADPSTTSIEQGYDLGQIQNPRDMAFGGAQAALGTSTVALYGNPAGLTLARVYHFEGLAAVSPEARRQSYGIAAVDSSTSRLAGGIAGTVNMLDPDGIHRTWTDVRLGLAYALGDRFSVGAAARYLRANQGITSGPFGASLASDGSPSGPVLNDLTFDLGATLVPADGFRIGIVGKNLTNPGVGFAPTTLQGGAGYTSDLFSVEADAMADFTTYKSTAGRYMAGAELFLGGHVPLRLGYRFDDGTQTHSVSGGLGYIDSKWSVEASVRQDVVSEHPSTMIGLSFRFFYNSENSNGTVDTSNEAF
jgi:hypothetical protein